MATASPLSPAHDSVLNASTPPPSSLRYDMYEVKAFTATHSVSGSSNDTISTETTTDATIATTDSGDGGDSGGDGGDGDGEIVSSPCENAVPLAVVTVEEGQENGSPTKRHSRILSGPELSPLKLARTVSNGSASSASASAAAAATTTAATAVSVLTAVPAFASERPDPGTVRSPRRPLAMERRFPVRVHSPSLGRSATPPPRPAPAEEQNPAEIRHMSLDEALKHNTGLAKAIEIFEDEDNGDPENDDYYGREGAGDGSDSGSGSGSVIVRSRWSSAADQGGEDVTAKILVNLEPEPAAAAAAADDYDYDEPNPADDTMMSTLSTFSAVPNLTMLSKFGNSPAKAAAAHVHHLGGGGGGTTPRGRPDPSPSRGRPRPYSMLQDSTATASLLMDFTDSMRFSPSQSPAAVSPTRGRNGYNAYGTPARNSGAAGNLIDFEIPPLPTPRSIPSVTPRELESLKSNFLSEISSLKASLSGKEAEVASLKTAVGDAEKRVGECMEQVREERAEREQLAAEKQDWERRGAEMEGVLRKMRDEMVATRREREELEAKLDESEKRREAAEMMAQEAESKMAGLRAGRAAEERERSLTAAPSPSSATAREVEQAVERVARELHALYKSKHETKVAALKKSYESRWEKRVRELEARLDEAAEENERIRAGHSSPALHRLDLVDHAAEEERRRQAAGDAARIRELAAEVEKLEAVTRSVRGDNDGLRHLLERERVEKGELVQLAEEMMAMQSFVAAAPPQSQSQFQPQPQSQPPATPRSVASVAPSPRKSMPPPPSRTPRPAPVSGLRAPAESRIGKGASAAAHERTQSGGGAARGGGGGVGGGMGGGLGGALPRPGGTGLGGMRSGIMSSIEKMGNHRGRGGE